MENSRHWAHTGSANCLAIGTRLAEFEITGVVGEGGFGNVYLAFDHSLQRTVAIKEYMPVALASRGVDDAVLVASKRHRETFQTGMNSFINEARLLAQFDHPALIKVYRFWEQNNTAYMAMRYYEGHTLKSIVTGNPDIVSEAWLKPILKPILEALEVLYKIQILHRDISPENIMIQANGSAVLLDFGAARQIIGGLTQALTVILKPGYAPVEQYAEDSEMKQGPWTDIYALSAVIYWTIVHKPPPTSVTRMIKDPIDLLQNSERPGFSKAFLAAIDRGMAVKPEDRPQSIAEFCTLLGMDLSGETPASPQPVSKPPGMEKRENTRIEAKKARTSKSDSGRRDVKGRKSSSLGSWGMIAAGTVLAVTAGVGLYKSWQGPVTESAAPLPTTAVEARPPLPEPPPAIASATAVASTTVRRVGAGGRVPAKADGNVPVSRAQPATVAAGNSGAPSASASPAPVASLGPSVADTAKPALVRLNVKPWANVLVDGAPRGVSPPLKRLNLDDGKHVIKFVNPAFPDHVVEITISDKRRFAAIDYDFTAK
ncbi:MAG: serine/threonine protein kinase [Burkholderiaceae bacterium]|nr:serine/threonine protein kinase [Burkholderiaceae bacterium]